MDSLSLMMPVPGPGRRARGIPSRVPARPDSGGHSEPAASEPGPLASGRLSDLSLPVSDSAPGLRVRVRGRWLMPLAETEIRIGTGPWQGPGPHGPVPIARPGASVYLSLSLSQFAT